MNSDNTDKIFKDIQFFQMKNTAQTIFITINDINCYEKSVQKN